MVDVDELVGVREIAAAFFVTRGTVTRWLDRPDFPQPVWSGEFRLWLLPQVAVWREATTRQAGHGTRNRYQRHCRCQPCREANDEYMRAYRATRRIDP